MILLEPKTKALSYSPAQQISRSLSDRLGNLTIVHMPLLDLLRLSSVRRHRFAGSAENRIARVLRSFVVRCVNLLA